MQSCVFPADLSINWPVSQIEVTMARCACEKVVLVVAIGRV